MLSSTQTRLAVWGDPIAHSRSPQLHAAAYGVLGLDWTYGRRRVDETAFADALGSLDGAWRGLSCTMPLKGAAFAAAVARDRRAELTGAVNTLLLDPRGARGFNTDVGGIVRALGDAGVSALEEARIIGAGATATSAVVALGELGARRIDVVARRPAAVEPLAELGARLGIDVAHAPFGASPTLEVPVTIATLPGDAPVPAASADDLAASGGLLMDVAYGHGTTALGSAWGRAERDQLDGLGMLLHQALLQVRIFLSGDVDTPLADEPDVFAAMRDAVTQEHRDAS